MDVHPKQRVFSVDLTRQMKMNNTVCRDTQQLSTPPLNYFSSSTLETTILITTIRVANFTVAFIISPPKFAQ